MDCWRGSSTDPEIWRTREPLVAQRISRRDIDVSIIVAVRNGAETIRQCIESVLLQQDCEIQLIVVDGESSDGTEQIVQSFGDSRLVYLRGVDQGIYDAWNKALRYAVGEWCSFLGSDDFFTDARSVVSLLSQAADGDDRVAFVYGGVKMLGAVENLVLNPNPPDPVQYIIGGRMLPQQGALHRRDFLIRIGGFDASYRINADRVAVVNLARMGLVRRSTRTVVAARLGGISTSEGMRSIGESELHRFLVVERGRTIACLLMLRRWINHFLGELTLAILARMLGRESGERAFLGLRRRLGKPPRMLPLRGEGRSGLGAHSKLV